MGAQEYALYVVLAVVVGHAPTPLLSLSLHFSLARLAVRHYCGCMVPETKARQDLEAWIGEHPKQRSRCRIARAMGISQPAVSAWLERRTRPEIPRRVALEVLTDGRVRSHDWTTDEERVLPEGVRTFRATEKNRG